MTETRYILLPYFGSSISYYFRNYNTIHSNRHEYEHGRGLSEARLL